MMERPRVMFPSNSKSLCRYSPHCAQPFTRLSCSCTAALNDLLASSDLKGGEEEEEEEEEEEKRGRRRRRGSEGLLNMSFSYPKLDSHFPICAKKLPLSAMNSAIISLVKYLRLVVSITSTASFSSLSSIKPDICK